MPRVLFSRVFLLMIGVFCLTACQAKATLTPADIGQQITQTMQAVATDAQATLRAAVPTLVPATETPLPTNTPLPTATPAPTETPVPATETSAPVPVAQTLATLKQSTNCRSGPAMSFALIYTAAAGESLTIVSRSTLDNYLVVAVPNAPGQTCWLWTEFATIQGDLANLPITNPPPTPTPAVKFTISYERLDPCTGWSLVFKVFNTGSKPLQSYTIVANDQTVQNTETTALNQFTERISCKYQEERGAVDPGQYGFIYENDFSYNPKGHTLLVYVTICSNNDMEGECASQGFFVTP